MNVIPRDIPLWCIMLWNWEGINTDLAVFLLQSHPGPVSIHHNSMLFSNTANNTLSLQRWRIPGYHFSVITVLMLRPKHWPVSHVTFQCVIAHYMGSSYLQRSWCCCYGHLCSAGPAWWMGAFKVSSSKDDHSVNSLCETRMSHMCH